jgi:hypothetical protein
MKIVDGKMTADGYVAKCPHCPHEVRAGCIPGGLEATRQALMMEGGWGHVCEACNGAFRIKLAAD